MGVHTWCVIGNADFYTLVILDFSFVVRVWSMDLRRSIILSTATGQGRRDCT